MKITVKYNDDAIRQFMFDSYSDDQASQLEPDLN